MKPVPPARPKRGDDPAVPIANADVAAMFDEIADLLELQATSVFRIRTYRNAARMLGELGRGVQGMVAQGEGLDALPGIGPGRARALQQALGIRTLEDVQRALA